MDYRHKNCFNVAKLPDTFEEQVRQNCNNCKDCKEMVLANTLETETYKNDYTGVYLKKSSASDLVLFEMLDSTGAVITNYGDVVTFPQDVLTEGFVYDWKQVLLNHGEGCYGIRVKFDIAGVEGEFMWGKYDLFKYTIKRALTTVRVASEFNSYLLSVDVDFTGSTFRDSVRFHGYFGDRQPETEINNLVDKGRKIVKTTRENLNSYSLMSDPLTINITKQLIDFHFLNEDKMFISDYNAHNHNYQYLDYPVALSGTADVKYTVGTRLASLTANFSDRALNQKSYYNQL